MLKILTRYLIIGIGTVLLFFSVFRIPTLQASQYKERTVEESCSGLATGILKAAKLHPMPEVLLLKTKGIEIHKQTLQEMLDKVEPEIRQQLERNLFFLLEQEATKDIILREARSAGIATGILKNSEAIKAFLNRVTKGVSVQEKEVRTFYGMNKGMIGKVPFEQVKESIRQFLLQQKRENTIAIYIQNLGQRDEIWLNSEWVKKQCAVAKENPVDKARMSGKPTMVEFGASGCVPCDMMQPILDKLRKKYPGKLNVVFVHVREKQVLAARFGIRAIPVQVFFDGNGREVFRHEGFLPEANVAEVLSKMGVK